MPPPHRSAPAKILGLVITIMALVCLPFLFLGQDYALPWLHAHEQRSGLLLLIAIALLAADSVAPVPSTVVIMFLAAKAGPIPGIVGSTIGLSAGVLTAAWFGRAAVGRMAPRFVPETELIRLRQQLQSRLSLTLACWRAVPVMAETSVILAAAAGVPLQRIMAATLLPNLLVAIIYSLAASDSILTAVLTFLVTLTASAGLWWFISRRATRCR